MAQVPARYIGQHSVILSQFGGPYLDGDGFPLTNRTIHTGDTLMVGDEELYGVTWLIDPKLVKDPVRVGLGRKTLDEHVGMSEQELADLGYQFHQGRPDFEPYVKGSKSTTRPLQAVQEVE